MQNRTLEIGVGLFLLAGILALLLLGLPAGMLAIGIGFSLWVDAARVADSKGASRHVPAPAGNREVVGTVHGRGATQDTRTR